jgi:hypothetical protein
MKKLLLSLLLFPTLLIAQPQSFLAGENINIDALKGINMCSGTGNITLATSCTGGGTQYTHKFNGTTGKFESTGGMSLPDGTAAAPSLNFTNDTNLGLYRIGDDDLGIAVNGAGELRLTGSSFAPVTTGGTDLGTASRLWNDVFFSGNMKGSNGSVSAPTYSFSGDTNTGIYNKGANDLGFACNGAGVLAVNTAELYPVTASGLDIGNGSLPFKDAYIADNIKMSNVNSKILISSTDGADNKYIYLSGGGNNSETRGAQFIASGNEAVGSTGVPYVVSGDVAGAYNDYDARHSTGYHSFKVDGAEKVRINATGEILGSGTATLGWTLVSVANQACTTTCTSPCVFGQETTSKALLACSDATADICLCAGAS